MKAILTTIFAISYLAAQQVLTAIPILETLSKELLHNTDVTVINPIGNNVPIQELLPEIKKLSKENDSLGYSCDAVVSLRSVIEEDQLFPYLRTNNIRIVEIDAATPLNPELTAIGTIRYADKVNPFIWTAPSALIRMAEIVGKDLILLYPQFQDTISSNLQMIRRQVREVTQEYEQKFLTLSSFEVATMDHSFDYLLSDINLFVTLSLPGEMEWTQDTEKEFIASAKSNQFKTVVHRWTPFGTPAELAQKENISFTVLKSGLPAGDSFDKGVVAFLRNNLEMIYQGLLD